MILADSNSMHISLRLNLTIKSHELGNEGHFCNCSGTSIHLPLTRGSQPLGQLSLNLLNNLDFLWREFSKGMIAWLGTSSSQWQMKDCVTTIEDMPFILMVNLEIFAIVHGSRPHGHKK